MGWLTEVKVDNVDVTNYLLDWYVSRSRDSDDVEPATVWLIKGVTTLNVLKHNSEITIKRGLNSATEQFIFKGTVSNITNENGILRCDLRPPHWKLKRQIINAIFDNTTPEAGNIVEIWKTIAKGENQEINVSAEDGSNLPVLNYFVCNGESRWESSQELRKLIKWQSYYRPDTDTYYLEPEGFTSFPTLFEVGKNVLNNPVWHYDMESIWNDITILGAFDDARFQESFDGDGVTKVFEVSLVPSDTEVYLGTMEEENLQRMGVRNSTEDFDYTVEKEKRIIEFETAPPAGTKNVIINYSFIQQRPVRQKNKESISNYGLSMFETSYDTILNIDDAKIQATALIDVYSNPFKSTSLKIIDYLNLFPGNRITILDKENEEIDTEVTVNKITYQFTKEHDEIEVGDKDYRIKDLLLDIAQNITQLYKRNKENQQIVTNVNLFETNLIAHTTYERYKLEPDTGVLYWDDENQGTWDDFDWGDDELESSELIKRTHTGNVFYDDFKSENYNTSSSTGTTINTTDGLLEIVENGTYVTQAIHIDGFNITNVRASWELEQGDAQVEVSTEKGLWRVVQNDTTMFFSQAEGVFKSFAYSFPMVFTGGGDETGKELYLRITNTHPTTVKFKKIKIIINE